MKQLILEVETRSPWVLLKTTDLLRTHCGLTAIRAGLRHTVQHLYTYLVCQQDLVVVDHSLTLSAIDRSHQRRSLLGTWRINESIHWSIRNQSPSSVNKLMSKSAEILSKPLDASVRTKCCLKSIFIMLSEDSRALGARSWGDRELKLRELRELRLLSLNSSQFYPQRRTFSNMLLSIAQSSYLHPTSSQVLLGAAPLSFFLDKRLHHPQPPRRPHLMLWHSPRFDLLVLHWIHRLPWWSSLWCGGHIGLSALPAHFEPSQTLPQNWLWQTQRD